MIDGADVRRSRPTLVAAKGVAAALVEGDHFLTTAYRLAAATDSPGFVTAFARAVERTVAGEKAQGRAAGHHLDEATWRELVALKSGELIGCALAAAAYLDAHPRAPEWHALGRRLGTLYQMLDDLLDYCPGTDSGKPPLGDFRARRWTWPLLELPHAGFSWDAEEVAERLADDTEGTAPLRRCLIRFEREAASVDHALEGCLPGASAPRELVASWTSRAREAVSAAEAARTLSRARAFVEDRAAEAAPAGRLFRRGSRSFSLAALLFPRSFRRRVERLYAFCRFTDDLADGGEAEPEERLARLDLWERLARDSYEGTPAAIPLLDDAMADAAAAGVSFAHVAELVEGMRMDVRGWRYASLRELRVYSHRVAGVVGQWLTRMSGVSDPWVLERAARLGHALQLTNILRDVGEDLARGRLYVPEDTLQAFGESGASLRAAWEAGSLPPRWPELLEALMAEADRDYRAALEALPSLPGWFRRPVAVAAHVYRGIHREIRANGYDNLRKRARTDLLSKLILASDALVPDQGGLLLLRAPFDASGPPGARGAEAPPSSLATEGEPTAHPHRPRYSASTPVPVVRDPR